MPQGFFQFFRRLSQNLKKAGLCPDISIRASGESSAADLFANQARSKASGNDFTVWCAFERGRDRNRPAGAVIIRGQL
ncbi:MULTISPECIES: hypothetical protein [Rhizobium]|jgi:hypothetical protein|uniref:Uncharacterized protein n=1 Tax=Rhizobium anhuiense TaxID=1184720 RepID=A0A3S0S4I6_9HYPH|nr:MULTISPECIES: hypothetical protein [Rhizobium]KZS52985.1 hypothetical protein AS890_01905 [Rhizobium anhuiense bv. trifolii]MBB3298903.1 hypothetical protein [Rhizobium sp. BK112]MBB3368373.1 hypothetical protein [Rhizobium sp. BK077]MBB3744691.1 hypothetical protein [Rhizobium sp. BK591]MBB4179275.1 hypothetical protein [Rhizobium sp. BK109]